MTIRPKRQQWEHWPTVWEVIRTILAGLRFLLWLLRLRGEGVPGGGLI